MCSRSLCSMVALVSAGTVARAEGVVFSSGPRLAITLTNGQKAFEIGIDEAIGHPLKDEDSTAPAAGAESVRSGRVFASVSVPFGDGGVVRIDRNTSDWRINLGGDLAYSRRREASGAANLDHSRSRYGLSLSTGHSDYAYYPSAGLVSQSESHWSISGTAHATWIHARQAELWAPQLSVTYDRSYGESSAVGILSPATATLPVHVAVTAPIAPPHATPTLAARASCPYALFPNTQFLVGPSVSHAFTGADRAVSPFGGDSGRLEGELWIYYVPAFDKGADSPNAALGASNARLGVAPFATMRTYGDDGQSRFTYGALVELRINSEIFDY